MSRKFSNKFLVCAWSRYIFWRRYRRYMTHWNRENFRYAIQVTLLGFHHLSGWACQRNVSFRNYTIENLPSIIARKIKRQDKVDLFSLPEVVVNCPANNPVFTWNTYGNFFTAFEENTFFLFSLLLRRTIEIISIIKCKAIQYNWNIVTCNFMLLLFVIWLGQQYSIIQTKAASCCFTWGFASLCLQ